MPLISIIELLMPRVWAVDRYSSMSCRLKQTKSQTCCPCISVICRNCPSFIGKAIGDCGRTWAARIGIRPARISLRLSTTGFSSSAFRALAGALAPVDRQHAQELEDDIGGNQRGDPTWVVSRQHLDEVHAHEVDPHQSTHQLLCLATGEATDLRCPGAGSEAGIDEVDVERQEDRAGPDPPPDRFQHGGQPLAAHVVGGPEFEAEVARL